MIDPVGMLVDSGSDSQFGSQVERSGAGARGRGAQGRTQDSGATGREECQHPHPGPDGDLKVDGDRGTGGRRMMLRISLANAIAAARPPC